MDEPIPFQVQSAVGSMSAGAGLRILKGCVFVFFLLVVVGFYAFTQFQGLRDAEAMDYAQLARNLAAGEGFTTALVRPISLWYFEDRKIRLADPARPPDIVHAPLYPVVLAAGFKVLRPSFDLDPEARLFAPERKVIVPFGVVLTLATALMIYLLGRRLFDPRAAALATGAYLLTEGVLADSISGLPIPLLSFLATAAAYVAISATQQREAGAPFGAWSLRFLLAALLCAAGCLTRYAFVVWIPAIAWLFSLSALRWRVTTFAVFVLAVLAAVSPWLLRNREAAHGLLGMAPLTVLEHTSAFSEKRPFERSLNMRLDAPDIATAIRAKLFENAPRAYDVGLSKLCGGVLSAFFLASFLYRFIRDEAHRLRWCVAGALALMTVLASLWGDSTAGLLRAFLPLVLLYGAAFFILLLDRIEYMDPAVGAAIGAAVLFVTALPLVFTLVGGKVQMPYPPCYPPFIERVARYLGPQEVLATDIPAATAWYGKRSSLLLPLSVADFDRIRGMGLPVKGLYLTQVTGNKAYARDLLGGSDRSWLPLLNGKIPSGFPLTDGINLPTGTRDQLFLTEVGRFPQ